LLIPLKGAGYSPFLINPLSEKGERPLPLVSVITVCLNNISGIEKTVQSVFKQNYSKIEYIIIDGGSTDGTVEVIRRYQSRVKFWVSEKDLGISDGFNKGFGKANGDYIAFLNSGDYYLDEHSIENLVNSADGFEVIYGGIHYQRSYKPEVYPKGVTDESYWVRGSIPHQSAITSRKVFDKIGTFKLSLKYCMDYELFYRAYEAGFKFRAIPLLICSVSCEGVSTISWKAQLDEFKKIQKERGASSFSVEFYYFKRFVKMLIYYTLVRLKLLK
jgi:glycosyltransferase involved in cell wall biosynthesis